MRAEHHEAYLRHMKHCEAIYQVGLKFEFHQYPLEIGDGRASFSKIHIKSKQTIKPNKSVMDIGNHEMHEIHERDRDKN